MLKFFKSQLKFNPPHQHSRLDTLVLKFSTYTNEYLDPNMILNYCHTKNIVLYSPSMFE